MGLKIRLITLDAGFYTVDVINSISQFKYIIAVPVGYVKVFEEFDGDYKTNVRKTNLVELVNGRKALMFL